MKNLVLRNCKEDGTSYGGFQWNTEVGAVNTAPDWEPIPDCGNGLHGWLHGVGDSGVSGYNESSLWLVLDVPEYIDLGDKVKFETCTVVFKGTKAECAKYLYDNGCAGKPIIGLTGDYEKAGDLACLVSDGSRNQTAGHYSTQTAGHYSTQKAGHYSTQKAGDESTQTAGDRSTQTAGDNSTQTAGGNSTQAAGYKSTQTAGHYSTQKAGYKSTQTAGHYSTQTAGYCSTQKAGSNSVITTGNESKVTAGYGSVVIHRFNGQQFVFQIDETKADKTFLYQNGQQYEI